MTWARFDDGFVQHPKIIGLTDGAFRLHVAAVCYSARNLLDGRIPAAALPGLRPRAYFKAADELVKAGVWERDGEQVFVIHDYLHYNPSAEEVRSKRSSKAMAGAKGAASRWHDGRNAPVPDPVPIPLKTSSTTARDALDDLYWRHFGHEPTAHIRSELENFQAVHPEDCVAWILSEVAGMAPEKRNWRYARFKFNDCEKEGHGPRNAARQNGVRPGSGAGRGPQQSQPSSGPDLAGWERARRGG